tara:strand:+ start:361 stop:591 length:231 start_codon:yes stop_codon:yes gene_type:complete
MTEELQNKILKIIDSIDEIQAEINQAQVTRGEAGIKFFNDRNVEDALMALESAVVNIDEFEDIVDRDEAYAIISKI